MKRVTTVIALVLMASSLALAADRDVKTVTRAIEKQYGVKHKGLPLIARVFMKPALWGSGVKLDMAMFEDMPSLPGHTLELDSLLGDTLGPGWSRFIRAESRKTGERSVIYVHTVGDKVEMMIVSIEPDETVVMKLRAKPDQMQLWMDEPAEMALNHHTNQAAGQAGCGEIKRKKDGFVGTE